MKRIRAQRFKRPLSAGRNYRQDALLESFRLKCQDAAYATSGGRAFCRQLDGQASAVVEHDRATEELVAEETRTWSAYIPYSLATTFSTTFTLDQLLPPPPMNWSGIIDLVGVYATPVGGSTLPVSQTTDQLWSGWVGATTLYPATATGQSGESAWHAWQWPYNRPLLHPGDAGVLTTFEEQYRGSWWLSDPEGEQRHREETERRARVFQAAKAKARSLLHSVLTEEQKTQLERHGHFYVVGSRGRRYCIRAHGQAGNVDWVDEQDKVLGRFCCHPSGVPDEDAWIAQMLAIATDEDHFLRTANVSAGRRPELTAA